MTEHALIMCREPGRHSTLDKGHEDDKSCTASPLPRGASLVVSEEGEVWGWAVLVSHWWARSRPKSVAGVSSGPSASGPEQPVPGSWELGS